MRRVIALSCLLLACGGDARPDMDSASTFGDAGEMGDEDTGDAGESGEGNTDKFDLGDGDGDGDDGGTMAGCTKVDFLFVVDSSGSMRLHQENLIASFPGFIQTIQDTLVDAQDHHIMTVDTDEDATAVCETYCGYGSPICSGYPCGTAAEVWGECDVTLGAGSVYPLGWNTTNMDCDFPEGRRYLVSDDANLEDTFACSAQVGTSMTGEIQMDAMSNAISDTFNAGDGCNAGFLREDAILVVTLISDEDDEYSQGDVDAWHDALVAAKGDNEDAVVMLGLISDIDMPGTPCVDEGGFPTPAPKLHEFVDSFSRHVKASVCEPDYTEFFEQAVSTIEVACDDFTPPG